MCSIFVLYNFNNENVYKNIAGQQSQTKVKKGAVGWFVKTRRENVAKHNWLWKTIGACSQKCEA